MTVSLQATHNEKRVLIIAFVGPMLNIPLNIIFFNKFGLIGIAYSTLVCSIVGAVLVPLLTFTTLKKQGYIV